VAGGFYLTDSVVAAAQFACYGIPGKSPASTDVVGELVEPFTWYRGMTFCFQSSNGLERGALILFRASIELTLLYVTGKRFSHSLGRLLIGLR
jgi:hypothetical protein